MIAIPEILLAAILTVESSNRPHPPAGDHGTSFGPYQISDAVLEDVNSCQDVTIFTRADCEDPEKARDIVSLYIGRWATLKRLGHPPTGEDMARIWNGGPDGWRKASTEPYWAKIQAAVLNLP
jgi:hypothetical protein